MPDASRAIALISKYVRNVDVAWEQILFINYTSLLQSGCNAVDIGGNVGWHSQRLIEHLACANLAIFEPIPLLAQKLIERFGGRSGVIVHELALSNWNGNTNFFAKPNSLGESGLRRKQRYGNGRNDDLVTIEVETRRLDDVRLGFAPDYIKVDVEGGEIHVLQGATDTIRRHRPIISVEFGSNGYEAYGHEGSALAQFSTKNDYYIYVLSKNSIKNYSYKGKPIKNHTIFIYMYTSICVL